MTVGQWSRNARNLSPPIAHDDNRSESDNVLISEACSRPRWAPRRPSSRNICSTATSTPPCRCTRAPRSSVATSTPTAGMKSMMTDGIHRYLSSAQQYCGSCWAMSYQDQELQYILRLSSCNKFLPLEKQILPSHLDDR